VASDGSSWSGDAKLSPQGSQPHTVFDLVSTSVEDLFTFKVRTYFPGDMSHLSPLATVTIGCLSTYTITQGAFVDPQYKPHDNASVGFVLPSYASAQQTGCPVNQLEVTASGTTVTAVAALKAPELVDGSYLVKPNDPGVH